MESSTTLKEEIRLRGCTIGFNCCGPIDIDHVKTRGSGGKDTEDNMMPLCRKHHIEKGQIGYGKMIKKYPRYLKWLLKYERHDIIEKTRRK